ncbi:MAG: gliding motility-associated C-terminal domain-containing protein [Sphingobacteriales bacterium]|nr:MAG: gliding motility-associated C-terminal domain-containing protein [Sphingobacteriales bacterium]
MKHPYTAIGRLLLYIACIFLPGLATAQYCTPTYSNPCSNSGATDYIVSFSTTGGITNISNPNTNCGNSGPNYVYYSTMQHTAAPGNTVNYSITNNPTWSENVKIWVDWNQDQQFTAANEQVANFTISASGTVTGSFTVPVTATPGTTRMRVRQVFSNSAFTACSAESFGETEDYNFVVQSNQPCSGTPTATVTSSSPTFCSAPLTPVTLTATAGTPALGYTYQWQSSPACAYTFSNIAGATNATYVISSMAAATHYRVIITCTNSGLSANSNIVNVYPACYCTSAATSTSGSDIGAIQVATTGFAQYNNPATAPASYTFNASANATYTNYSSLPAINLIPGTNSSFVVAQMNSGAYTSAYLKIFVDFNRDGDFTDVGEQVYQGANTGNPGFVSFTGFIPVPAGTQPGNTRMRFVLRDAGNGTTVTPCGNYTNGETEDYIAFIRPVINPVTASSNSPLCAGDTLQLNAATASTCAMFTWTGPNGFTSNQQNPVIPAAGTNASGTYTLTVSSFNVSTTVTTNVVVNPASTSADTTTICAGSSIVFGTQTITAAGVYTESFPTAQGCDSIVTLTVNVTPLPAPPAVVTPLSYCQGAVATALSASGSGLLWYTTLTGGLGTAAAPVPSTSTVGSTTYYVSQTVNGCESPRDSIVVTVTPAPATPIASGNSPVCVGNTLTLSATSTTGASFTWTGPGGFTSALSNPSITNVQAVNGGNYSVTASIGSCTSAVATVAVVVNPTPIISGTTFVNPTACNLNNGEISIAGLQPGTSYSVSYVFGGNTVTTNISASGTGNATITGLAAGTYTAITVSLGGCTSTPAGPVTLTAPSAPAAPVASSNSPVCAGETITLTASAIAGATYQWTGPGGFSSTLQNPTIPGAPLTAGGTYSVTATINGCVSTAATTTVVVNPLPVISAVNGTNPTTCNGTNGSISISGLLSGSTYTVNYSMNSLPQPAATLTANGSGVVTITGLAAATYSGITVTLNGCTSTAAGPVIINNPTAPAPPVVSNNGPLCAGATLNLTASAVPGATYSWSGPGGFSSALQNPVITNAQTSNAGIYSVTVTVNGCNSAAATTTVVISPAPAIASVSGTNPTGCNLTDGSIQINGLQAGTTYTIAYTSGSTPVTATYTANAAGAVIITGLAAGTYSGFTAAIGSCVSPAAGPVTLTNPPIPATPTAGSNTPICSGSSLTLTAASIAGATYSWTGPGGFSSTVQNPVIANATTAASGTYSVTATVNGCTSTAGTTTVVVNPVPVISSAVGTDPTGCTTANGSIQLSGLGNNLSYSVTYILNSGAPVTATVTSGPTGNLVITGLGGGTYTGITVSINGCTSLPAGPVTLVPPSSPAAPTVSNNGPLCAGTTLNLTATTVTGATYTWTGPGGFTSSLQNPVITNAQAANGGVYSVTATINGCTSAAGTTTVVVNPTPVIATITPASPTTCGGSNGSVTLGGLTANTTYAISYIFNSVTTTATYTSSATGTIVILNLAPGTYSGFTATLGSCTSAVAGPVTILSPAPPPAPVASSNSPVCDGGSINLTASTVAGGTYIWSGPNGFSSTVQNPVITGAGLSATGVYSVTVTVNNCTSLPATTSVTVNPVPVIASTSFINPASCNGTNGSISLTGLNAGVTYTVGYLFNTTPQTVTATSGSGGSITLTGLASGTYSSITVTLNGCTSAATGPIVLSNPAGPATPTAANNGPVCEGQAVTLTTPAVAGGTYSWTGPNGFTSSLQNPGISSANAAAAGVYSVTVTVNNCTSLPGTTTLVVNPIPATPVITANTPVCEGSDLNLSSNAAAGTALAWTGPNGFSSTGQNPVVPAVSAANGGVYSLVVSLNGCSSLAGTVNVAVTPLPAAPLASDDTFCQNTAIPPLTAIGQNLLWYTTATGGTGTATAPTPANSTVGTLTWYVSQTVNGCEGPRDTVSVTVAPAPLPPVVSSPVVYCQDDSAIALNAPGQNLLWYTQPVGGIGDPNPPIPQTGQPGTYTWYVSASINGCEGDRAMITVIVNPTPAAPLVNSQYMFCQGDPGATITAAGQGLTWYTDPAGINGSTSAPVINTDSAGTYYYYVSQTLNGCESPLASITVIINELVTASIDISNNNPCQFDTVTISAPGQNPAGAVYTWNFDGGTVLTGIGAGPYLVRYDAPGAKNVTVTVQNFACQESATMQLNVKPSPTGDFALKDNACIDEVMYVQAAWNSLGAAIYTWDFGNATVVNGSGAGAYKLRFETAGSKVISLVTFENGCRSLPHADTITIHENPVAQITPVVMDRICRGDEFVLIGGPDMAGYSYSWSPAAFFSVNGLAQVTGTIKAAGDVVLEVTNPYGCSGRDSLYFDAQPCCTVSFPDAFTPNGDGRNDVFRLITDGTQQISIFRVVNRWGQTVFQTADPKQGWDGTYNGEPQQTGTFYYYLRYQCGTGDTFEKRGEVTLIR